VGERIPFTVIDEAVHLLDTPAEPWSIELELGLEGQVDESRLRSALGTATSRHPMARVHAVPARRTDRTWTWEVDEVPDLDPLSVVECAGEPQLSTLRDRLQSLRVPLAESPPWRLRLARRPDGDHLLLNANHAAFDGFGCVRLLRSLARAYTGVPDPLPDVELAEARDLGRLLGAHDPEARARRLEALRDKLRDLVRPPARIAADGGVEEPGYRILHLSLSADGTARLGDVGLPGTVNDLLMAALHLAVDGWNAEHGAPCGRVSVLMPVNLRPDDWRTEVVTNVVLDSRIVTEENDRRHPRAALESVADQTDRLKRWGTGAALMEVLGRSGRLPLWVKQSLSPLLSVTGNRLVDTAIFSNLGKVADPPDFGSTGGASTGAWFSAPARLPCGMSVGAATVGRRLHLSFRARRPMLDGDGNRRFARRFLDELARLVGDPSGSALV
jgi:NRPS condensation-like uncharacterized protein